MIIRKYSPTSHRVKALVYGASGSGKTTFAGTAKNALFLSAEGGLLSVANRDISYVEVHSFKDLDDALAYLKKNPEEFSTVIIDSITEINDIIMTEIESKTRRKMQIQDYGELARKMKSVLRSFRDLDMHVLFLAHEKNIENDGNITKIVPEIAGKASTGVAGYMDVVGYIQVGKNGERTITTNATQGLLTKDRSGVIGNDAELDFESWIARVKKIEVKEQNIVYSDDIVPDQISRIRSLWGEYTLEKDIDEEKSESILQVALKRDFHKVELEELTFKEAEIFSDKLEKTVHKLKVEALKDEEEERNKPGEIEYEEEATADDVESELKIK